MTGILSLTTYAPLIGVAAILALRVFAQQDDPKTAAAARWIALATTLATFALSVIMVAGFHPRQAGFQFSEDTAWFAGLHYSMGVDGISVLFVLLTTFLMPLCIVASWRSITVRVVEYMIAFLVLESLVVGVFCALDLLVFYLFFEGQLIPMFLIIGIWGGKNRVYAAFKFFLYTLLGSVLMLAAILAMIGIAHTSSIPELMRYHFSAGDPDLAVARLLRLLRGEDADVAGAHLAARRPRRGPHRRVGDPRGHPAEDGRLRLHALQPADVPPGELGVRAAGLRALSAIAIVYTSLVAFRQTDMKKLIAYSSVAHMGFVTMGIFSGTLQGEQGALFQMLSHGVISGALFLCVGVVYDRMHTREIAFYGGVVNRMPLYAAVFMLFTMGNVGLPGTSGFVGEILTLTGTYGASTWTAIGAALGMILSAVYALTLYRRVVFGEMTNPDAGRTIGDMERREMLTFLPLIAATLYLGLHPGVIFHVTEGAARHLADSFQAANGRAWFHQ